MSKVVAVALCAALLCGCGVESTGESHTLDTVTVNTVCIDGVKYMYWRVHYKGFSSVILDRYGRVEPCEPKGGNDDG